MSFPSGGRKTPRRGTCPVSWGAMGRGRSSPIGPSGSRWVSGMASQGSLSQSCCQLSSALLSVLLDKKEPLPTPVTKPKLDSALYKVNAFWDSEVLACMLLGGMPLTELSAWGAKQGVVSGFL